MESPVRLLFVQLNFQTLMITIRLRDPDNHPQAEEA